MAVFGLLGEKLSHSYSPEIHGMLGDYPYGLYEKAPEDVEDFIRHGQWDGLNVTIPYKKTVFPFLDRVSDEAREAGCVNTLIRKDGRILGYNTDIYGFQSMVRFSGISVSGCKALVLGSGGASAAVLVALKAMGCTPVVISRSGPDNYQNLDRHRDADLIVNTTPVGMYPHNGEAPLDLRKFPECKGVLDVIYNPLRTGLLLQAEELGLAAVNGLYMLVAQAKRSAEIFTGKDIDDGEIVRIYRTLSGKMQNIVLIGMPGCGKSVTARALREVTGREVVDTDDLITELHGRTPAQIITEDGEAAFRVLEREVIENVGKMSGKIIATGGGVVTRPENYAPLHQQGTIFWLKRRVSELPTHNRPLSAGKTPAKLYEEREPLYRAFSDAVVDLDREDAVSAILNKIEE